MAFAVVAIMLAAGFVMLVPVLKPDNGAKAGHEAPEKQAAVSIGGPRQVTYTISNLFESYQKVSGPQSSHSGPPGINSWWPARQVTYGDVVVRNAFPYIIGYGPYSAEVPGAGVTIPTMKYGLYGFYRITIVANNLTSIGTGPGKEVAFFPILYPSWTTGLGMDGGWMNFSYYLTYATVADENSATSGTGYQYTYYGVTGSQFNFQGVNADDGWYIEVQGKLDFDRAAAKKFLGLTGSADLRTQFTANNTGANLGKMNKTLSDFWNRDGSATGGNDTYASYDYSLDVYPINVFLSVDPASTSSKLVLRLYSICWGLEYLMNRYLDGIGVMSKLVTSPEDWYLNGTVGPAGADIFTRYISCYNMLAWKDPGFFSASWMIDTVHMDYTPNNALHPALPGKWISRYNPYTPTKTYKPTYMVWSPGTLTYGAGAAYWYPPMAWNLTAGEKLIVKLPASNKGVLGITPYLGTGTQDTLNQGKVDEIATHNIWGEVGLGTLYPSTLRSATYYNHATKTLTITGPTSFNRNPNSAFHALNATGTPNLQFDIMRVSGYNATILEAMPAGGYAIGVPYTLQLVAKNVSGAVVTDWNGTVDLTATTGTTLGASSLTFGPANNGIMNTTVTFTSRGLKIITATDRNNGLDVVNTVYAPVLGTWFKLTLVAGWNLISVPFINGATGGIYRASNLTGLVTGDVLVEWNSTTQTYTRTYIKGVSGAAQNFNLNASTGYWVWVASTKTVNLFGILPTTTQTRNIVVPANGGWATVGFMTLTKTYLKARNITTMIPPAGKVTTMAKFDPNTKSYTTWLYAVPSLNNFALVTGQGYWAYLTSSGTLSYTP